jgi:hypothetical protein
MLLIDFLSKVQPFIPYDITAITLFYFVDFNHEENKGIIRIHKSRKNRQHIGQKKKYKRRNNDLQTYT